MTQPPPRFTISSSTTPRHRIASATAATRATVPPRSEVRREVRPLPEPEKIGFAIFALLKGRDGQMGEFQVGLALSPAAAKRYGQSAGPDLRPLAGAGGDSLTAGVPETLSGGGGG